jgi:hypothetical protein
MNDLKNSLSLIKLGLIRLTACSKENDTTTAQTKDEIISKKGLLLEGS